MNLERWNSIISDIKDKFTVLDERHESFEDMPGDIHVIEFETPVGRVKLEFTQRPLVLDKKSITSHRIGAHAKVEYTYSETESTYKMSAYKWNDRTDEWEDMKSAYGE